MKNRKAPTRASVIAFLVGLVIPIGATAAYAAVSYSSVQDTGTVNGYSYYNQSSIEDGSSGWAGTSTGTTNSVSAPSGYMGAWAGLWSSNGVLCKQTSWYYNSGSAIAIGLATAPGSFCGTGNYYSYGESKAYTGSGYIAYHTYQSPTQNL